MVLCGNWNLGWRMGFGPLLPLGHFVSSFNFLSDIFLFVGMPVQCSNTKTGNSIKVHIVSFAFQGLCLPTKAQNVLKFGDFYYLQ